MNLGEFFLVLLGGLVAGMLNVLAAGGAIVSFVVLTGLGMPPHIANATSLAATPASFLATVRPTWRNRREHARHWPLLVVAVLGTIAGVMLFQLIPAGGFRAAAPILLILATGTLVIHPVLKRFLARRGVKPEATHQVQRTWTVIGIAVTSVYAGFFGGGVGVAVLAVFALATNWPWLRANDIKNGICLLTALVGLLAYATTGPVDVPVAITLGMAMAAGGFLGQLVIEKLPRDAAKRAAAEDILRQTVAVFSAFGAGVMVASS